MKKTWLKALVVGGVLVSSVPFNVLANETVIKEKVVQALEEMAVVQEDGTKVAIDVKNATRTENTLVIYTDSFGATTRTNPWGVEVIINADGVVEAKTEIGKGGNATIPKRGYVLSGNGAGADRLSTIQVGEKLELKGLSLVELNKETKYKLGAVNPNRENNPAGVDAVGVPFPGFRGADQVVVYTPEYGSENTGTNDYGIEVRVEGTLEEGTIVSTGGNNSAIPKDGYVLSGHGAGASFLINDGMIGAKVSVNEETGEITLKVTPESILQSVETDVTEAGTLVKNALTGLYDIPVEKAEASLQATKDDYEKAKRLSEQLEGNDSDELKYEFLDTINSVRTNVNQVRFQTMESRDVEGRGIWHRPSEKNLDDVRNTLEELKANNVNTLFLETFYQGYTIYPSKNPIAKQHPNFKDCQYGSYGNDLLKAFVEEAKNYGIELHVWVEDFFVGEKDLGSPILEQKPEWKLLNYDGTDLTKLEGGVYRFMDPSIPEARAFLVDIYSEMVQNYDIHGLQLDYIRYPVGEYKNDSGYGEYSINVFKEKYDIAEDVDIRDLMDKEKSEDWELWWNRWNEWKQNNISTFVHEVHDTLKKVDSDILISTAIFPNISEAMDKKMQNWPLWVQSGWIDLTTPMAYYQDTQTVLSSVESMVQYVGGNALNYAGIAPTFIGMSAEHNAHQTRAAQLAKAQGSSIFASQNLLGLPDVSDVLTNSTYRDTAVTPHSEMGSVLRTGFSEMRGKAERIYIQKGAMTKKQFAKLEKEFVKIESVKVKKAKDLDKVAKEIAKLSKQITKFANGEAANRLKEDLDYLQTIVETRQSMMERNETK